MVPGLDGRDDDRVARHANELRTQGYTILPDVLPPQDVQLARAALEDVFRREDRIARRRGWLTDAYRVSYLLPEKHALFRSFCERPVLLALVRAVLGESCVLGSLNGLGMLPGGNGQALHLDQAETVPGLVVTVNALHTLDDFTRENGATRLVPGSQERVWTGDAQAIATAEADAIHLEAPAGSIVAYSGGAWHAASPNRTAGPRRAIHAFFCRAWVRPHWSFAASLSTRVARELTPAQRTLFGFDLDPRRYDALADRSWRGVPSPGTRWRAILRRRLLGR